MQDFLKLIVSFADEEPRGKEDDED